MSVDRAYLSIVDWPEGFGEPERIAALASAGIDEHQAALCVRRGFPQVVACLDSMRAQAAVDLLHAQGVTSFAPERSAMRALPAPILLKDMAKADGAPEPMFACEAWRGEPLVLKPAEIRLIVRGRVDTTETRTSVTAPSMTGAVMFGGIGGAIAVSAMNPPSVDRATRQLGSADVIDLFLPEGVRARISSSKFRFDVLGDARGATNHDNAAALLQMLGALAPRAIMDIGFADFRCPPDVMKGHWSDIGPGTLRRESDAPAFDFYSAWAYLMYRQFGAI
jgi:hypothetical protein